MNLELEKLLQLAINNNASDLIIAGDSKVYIRKNSLLEECQIPLSINMKDNILKSLITTQQLSKLESNIEIDFSFQFNSEAYFRAHYYKSMGKLNATFRYIPSTIPSLTTLNLSNVYEEIINKNSGLVLITGSTSSGKSTTIASILDFINEHKNKHIITLEDPIEFRYKNIQSIFSQRTIGIDTQSFKHGIKSALRQSPDIIVVGEIRDKETMESAIHAAQTGHLVFATLHTSSAIETINRILNLFDESQKNHIQSILSSSLISITSQTLIPTINKQLELISEIMIPNSAIKNLIKEGKIEQIYSHMKLNKNHSNMTTQTDELKKLILKNKITKEMAISYANMPTELNNN